MLIEKISPVSGKIHSMDLDITPEQLEMYYSGKYSAQHVFYNLTAGEREFIKTGITPSEWSKIFKEEG